MSAVSVPEYIFLPSVLLNATFLVQTELTRNKLVPASIFTAQCKVPWKELALMRPQRVKMVLRSFPTEATHTASVGDGAGILSTR